MPMLLTAVASVALLSPAAVSIDGDFQEWDVVPTLATDPAGDASGAFDVTSVKAVGRGSELSIFFDIGQTLNYQSGNPGDGTLIITLAVDGGDTVAFNMRSRAFTVNGASAPWTAVNFNGAPTYADSAFEMRFDLGAQGAAAGVDVTVSFAGSDAVAPATVTMGPGKAVPSERSADRGSDTSFRIVNLNTLQSGLTDGGRGPLLARLIDAVDADVYDFQEEWDNSEAQIAAAMQAADPHGDGAAWNIAKNSGTVIASRSALIPIPVQNSKYVAAVVDLPAGPVAVFSIHLKCCGFTGSSEDNQRNFETNQIIQTISQFRFGNLGENLVPYADVPVVVTGDWNLVGSRTPLTYFENDAGLQRLDAEHLASDDIFTWRNANSSFTPGYLDLMAHSPDLTPRNRYVLDTSSLQGETLTEMGLLAGDSNGSDHLMVVGDFTFGPYPACPGDVSGDGTVNFEDLNELLQFWSVSVIPGDSGDLDGNGTVDFGDLNELLEYWDTTCE